VIGLAESWCELAMLGNEADGYMLIVFDSIEAAEPVRDLLCEVTGMHPTDAMRWVARMPCVGAHPLTKVQADRLLEGLYELGVAGEARKRDAIPTLAPARTARTVACLPEGFRVKGLRGEPIHWVPWSKIELIDAAWVDQKDATRAVGAPSWMTAVRNAVSTLVGRPRMLIGRRPRTMRFLREPSREVVLVRREPRLALHMQEGSINYSYLGEKLRPTAAENFPLFLSDLCGHAKDAYLTPSTRRILGGHPSEGEESRQKSSQELVEDAGLWLLWSWYRRDRDDDLKRRRRDA
jgi:hypothetical protein